MATSKAKYALVAESMSKAIRLADTFNLDRKEWRLISFGDSLAGRRFDKIIVFWPAVVPEHWDKWYDMVLRTKLPPDVKPINF